MWTGGSVVKSVIELFKQMEVSLKVSLCIVQMRVTQRVSFSNSVL